MNPRSLSLIALISILSFSSCKLFVRMAYGVDSTPNMKSKKDIEKYVDKKKLGITSQYTLSPNHYEQVMNKTSLPHLKLYNSDGYLLKYASNKNCIADADGLLKRISKSETEFPTIDSIHIDSTLKHLHTLDGTEVNIQNKNEDYTAVIYWATFLGRLNKDNIPAWINDANNNEQSNIRIIIINMDLQEWWSK